MGADLGLARVYAARCLNTRVRYCNSCRMVPRTQSRITVAQRRWGGGRTSAVAEHLRRLHDGRRLGGARLCGPVLIRSHNKVLPVSVEAADIPLAHVRHAVVRSPPRPLHTAEFAKITRYSCFLPGSSFLTMNLQYCSLCAHSNNHTSKHTVSQVSDCVLWYSILCDCEAGHGSSAFTLKVWQALRSGSTGSR